MERNQIDRRWVLAPFAAWFSVLERDLQDPHLERRDDKIILLGAHYDTVSSTPGADDNASAVAVLLEASRLLRELPTKRSIRYVAFACEEPPYFNLDAMGSQHHARQARWIRWTTNV